MLNHFFAVTMTSIYEVKDRQGNLSPFVKKIVNSGKSTIPVGVTIEGGTMLSIGLQLIVFIPEGGGITSFQRQAGQVNTRFWGGLTSFVVALFLNENEARACLGSDDIESCDPRWIEKTKEVIDKIGEEHPVFSICHSPGMELILR